MKRTQNLLIAFMLAALMMSSPVFGATSEVSDFLSLQHVEVDPKVLSILEQMDLEALEQQVAALGLGEGDQLVAVISEEGELLELGALEVQVASQRQILGRLALDFGTMGVVFSVTNLAMVMGGLGMSTLLLPASLVSAGISIVLSVAIIAEVTRK